jgi:hypothetical protein
VNRPANGPVLRIVRGQADADECAAVVVAVLDRARRRLAARPVPPAPGPGRALWPRDPRGAYRSPGSWQS